MIIDDFDITTRQVAPNFWLIEVITPDKNKFVGQIQGQGNLTPEIAYEQVWKNPELRKQFFLELDVKLENDIVKT